MKKLSEEELYQETIRFLDYFRQLPDKDKYVSVTLIQRRFRIGYTSAKKIVERLEEEGYVSKYEHGQPRKLLK